ncbi:LLM class flavin-dependent oxidoreductase [Klebsiella variicola subsp. variicola]|nr:LLM class flavin-dependent oxidoreductase [Klebsiella variicola subsp. variicola]
MSIFTWKALKCCSRRCRRMARRSISGGSSEAAIDVAAEQIDSYLTWGEPRNWWRRSWRWCASAPRPAGRTLRYGIRLHVIVRETEEEAWAAADRLIAHLDDDTIAQAQRSSPAWTRPARARMSALHQGSRDNLRIAPNLWGRRRTGARRRGYRAGR